MIKRMGALVCALLLLLIPAAGAEKNLLQNPGFEETDGSTPLMWTRDMWYWEDGISEVGVSEDACMGRYAACVDNVGENDARFEQRVSVEPETLYRITCMARVQGCSDDVAGAGISIKDTFVSSEPLYETDGEWRKVTLYGRTGPEQTELTVMARVGGYSSLNVGRAWFDDFEMVAVDQAEAGYMVYSFVPLSLGDEEGEDGWDDGDGEGEGAVDAAGVALILAAALFFALAAGAAVLLAGRGHLDALDKPGVSGRAMLAMLLCAAAIRLVLSVLVRGYGVDMNCFEGWALRMAQTGPSGFYTADAFCDYPPAYMYVLWACGRLTTALGIPYDNPAMWLTVKFVPIATDIAMAYVVYRAVRASFGDVAAVPVAALVAFNPALIVNSAAWGQVDVVLAALLAVSMLAAARGEWLISLPVYALAVLVKPQALMFGPLGLLMVAFEIISSKEKGKAAGKMLLAALAAAALMLLAALPFMTALPAELTKDIALPAALKPLGWLVGLYRATLSSYPYITINACNLYTLLGMNWASMALAPLTSALAWALMGLSYVYAFILYIRAKDRGKIFLVAATLLTLVFAFGPKMHERYVLPALILLPLAYSFDRDIRVLVAWAVLSVTQFLNIALVLQNEYLLEALGGINRAVSLGNVLAAAFLAWTAWEMCVSGRCVSLPRVYRSPGARAAREGGPAAGQESLLRLRDARLNLKRRDWFFMITLSALYAVLTFVNLGSTAAPETAWKSTAAGEQITFDLGRSTEFHMTYYGGICSPSFMVQFSDDGEVWSETHYAEYDMGQMYRWLWYRPCEKEGSAFIPLDAAAGYPLQTARYVRIVAERAGLILNEVGFLDGNGAVLPVSSFYAVGGDPERAADPKALLDEQDTVPPYPSYYNGMYFDEIYHGRTAYEHLNGLHAYEYTHPPLGKVLIMVGIRIFGMTPFGWRFMPALFGLMMVPLMYLLGKQLFKRSSFALVGAFLMATDLMHFTQSRLATIDVFAVFFIMLMYLFMIRYAMMSFYHQKLGRTLIPLALSGASMGLAIACKWIGVYGAVGLAIIFFSTIVLRVREYLYAKRNLRVLDVDQRRVATRAIKTCWRFTAVTLAMCLLFFIVVPSLIYYASYYWHLAPDGGLSPQAVWDTQVSMFEYHSGVSANAHYFASPWYEWPLIIKPMWYYSGSEFLDKSMVSSISCMGNPAVWWGGLMCLLLVMISLARDGLARLTRRKPGVSAAYGRGGDRRRFFLVVGFLSQYVPWMFIARATFIYHYFASVPFLILCALYVLEWVRRRSPRAYHIAAGAYCALSLSLFAAFYPLASGLPASREYVKYLRWFNWYNY